MLGMAATDWAYADGLQESVIVIHNNDFQPFSTPFGGI
jgi:hypothetical protein